MSETKPKGTLHYMKRNWGFDEDDVKRRKDLQLYKSGDRTIRLYCTYASVYALRDCLLWSYNPEFLSYHFTNWNDDIKRSESPLLSPHDHWLCRRILDAGGLKRASCLVFARPSVSSILCLPNDSYGRCVRGWAHGHPHRRRICWRSFRRVVQNTGRWSSAGHQP